MEEIRTALDSTNLFLQFAASLQYNPTPPFNNNSVAFSLWGAIYGMKTVPARLYENLEYRSRLEELGQQLFVFSASNQTS